MNKNIFKKGQGVVESVFAIGVLALLMGGAVILIVMAVNNRRAGFDRRRAMELETILMEELVAKSQNDPEHFWLYENNGTGGLTRDGFSGYTYMVTYNNIAEGNVNYPNCGTGGKINCAEVSVTVSWTGKTPQSATVNRFFSKK